MERGAGPALAAMGAETVPLVAERRPTGRLEGKRRAAVPSLVVAVSGETSAGRRSYFLGAPDVEKRLVFPEVERSPSAMYKTSIHYCFADRIFSGFEINA